MGMRGRWLLTTMLLLASNSALRAADEGLAVQLRRPARAGDLFDVHLQFEQTRMERQVPVAATIPASRLGTAPLPASASQTQGAESKPAESMPAGSIPAGTIPAGSMPAEPRVSEHALKVDLTCRVEVVEVNFRGETALWVTIGKFVSLPENKELVPAGKVIGLQYDGTDVYLAVRGGGDLSEDARSALQHVHPLEYQLDDESFGSRTPRKAGESWDVDAGSVARMDSNVNMQVDPASVKGKVTLVGPEKLGAISGVRLNIDLAHSGKDRYRKASGEMLAGEELKMQISALLPQDKALPAAQIEVVTDRVATGTRQVGTRGAVAESILEIRTHTVEKQTITVVTK